jgi:hypothetical protein
VGGSHIQSAGAGRAASRGFRLQPEERTPGQIVASSWFPRPRKAYVSGSGGTGTTPLTLPIETLSAAAYGRTMPSDADLDEALDAGERGIREVARRYTPWARLGRALKHSALGLRDKAWAR